MRRSAAPSQKAGGLPPLKRTKFNTPFVNGNDHSHQIVLEIPSSANEDHKVQEDSIRTCRVVMDH
jgi:hypothetical protein